jgi:hypothetical protein
MSWVITPEFKNKLLLDTYSGAAAAYSLRNLTILSNAPVVRVRRSSDNAEDDFFASEITQGGRLTTFTGAGNGFVRTLYDQSGNGNHASQPTTAAQPQIVSSGTLITSSGSPAISFSGNEVQNLPIVSISNKTLTYFIAKDTADTGYQILDGNGYSAFSWAVDSSSSNTALNSGFSSSSLYVNSSLQSPVTRADLYSAFNGRKLETTLTTTNASWATTRLLNNCNCKLMEFIVYFSSQTANRAAIESNINAHYAIY